MTRSVRQTRNLIFFVLVPGAVVVVGLIGANCDRRLFFIGVPLVYFVSLWARTFLVCPHCSTPVGRRTVSILGFDVHWYSYLTPRYCTHCGKDLGTSTESLRR